MVDMEKREYPIGYMVKAYMEFDKSKQYDIDILEIGCMRQEMNHDLNETCAACCDGHSTHFWGSTGRKVVSVDVNAGHIALAKKGCSKFDNILFLCVDAISHTGSANGKKIGLLFLDAWDVDMPDCAEKHLEFFEKMEPLNDDCLVLIDDTDLYWDDEKKEFFPDEECLSGKGRLLIPYMLEKGYEIVFKGRQTLLRKK